MPGGGLESSLTENLPSTFVRTAVRRKKFSERGDFDEFDTLGVFPPKQDRQNSPTDLKMKLTALLSHSNRSFDQYFYDMRRRNVQKSMTAATSSAMMEASETISR